MALEVVRRHFEVIIALAIFPKIPLSQSYSYSYDSFSQETVTVMMFQSKLVTVMITLQSNLVDVPCVFPHKCFLEFRIFNFFGLKVELNVVAIGKSIIANILERVNRRSKRKKMCVPR